MKPYPRINKRFVLAVLAAAVTAGLLASTGWTWRLEWSKSQRSAHWRVDDRSVRCDGDGLLVSWVVKDAGDPPVRTLDPQSEIAYWEWSEEAKALMYVPGRALLERYAMGRSPAWFRQLGSLGWACGSRPWVVRTVLGAPFALGLWAAWRMRPRWRAGSCPRCGYDRTGLGLSAKCPECGAAG
jgi:hypothetical protein